MCVDDIVFRRVEEHALPVTPVDLHKFVLRLARPAEESIGL